jgi:hypothetical protein
MEKKAGSQAEHNAMDGFIQIGQSGFDTGPTIDECNTFRPLLPHGL